MPGETNLGSPVKDKVFKHPVPISDCPSDFIPAGTVPFVSIDKAASVDYSGTVKGFYDKATGVFTVQEVSFYDSKGDSICP